MTSDFSVARIRQTEPMALTPPSGVRKAIYESASYGPLLESDKRMLEEFSGMEFDWPPVSGGAFPGDAVGIALIRKGQLQDGARLGSGDLMSAMSRLQSVYQRMNGSGIFTDEFMTYVAQRSADSPAAFSQLARLTGRDIYA
ncbi:hypothetical protein BJY21_004200 [Kineosphaera limosa]|uniref:Uncharacterized protein n=1 Tax=Kineosphaera limosa NBRC 100340 TaxID=1184609 RepID=K6WMQ3_9MICO|nr:hypothetical protein [Kineosphaera limosa]NYE03016.1 hypothetical protein [Kineosphaera limosa]GAB95091.1 hypothetical protein KILIM_016_00310 [Kineosphaera limosa NBRC 100340]